MSTVYRAAHADLEREVALKIVRPIKTVFRETAEVLEQRFLREARVMARLHHPGVVTVYDFGREDDGALYLAMELLRGTNLEIGMRTLTPRQVAGIGVQVLEALATAHDEGLIHRDIKPSNVLLLDVAVMSDRTPRAKLMDFGVAKTPDSVSTPALTAQGDVVGTAQYMAPEQARGEVGIDHRVDVYAVGAMLYHCLTGRLPFDGPSALSILHHIQTEQPESIPVRPDLPPALVACIERAMAKTPEERYAGAREMANAVRAIRWTHIESISARPPIDIAAARRDAQPTSTAGSSAITHVMVGLAGATIGIIVGAWLMP